MKINTGILTVLLSLLFLTLPQEAYPKEEAGEFLTVRKSVFTIRDGQRNAAKAAMPLLLQDIVETGKKARTKLYFTDDSILNLGEKSRLEVKEYLYSPEKKRSRSVYSLVDGYMKVVVGRSDLEIHTPTAVAAARGTKFIITSDSHRCCVYVSEGEVLMKSTQKEIKEVVVVNENMMTCVPDLKMPETPRQFSSEEFNKLNVTLKTAANMINQKTIVSDLNSLPSRSREESRIQDIMLESESFSRITNPPATQEPLVPSTSPTQFNIIFPQNRLP